MPNERSPQADRTSATHDVVVLGAGIAGLALALHLLRDRPGLRVAVIDPGPLPVDAARSKVGESSTEVSSWYLAHRLGLGEHLRAAQIKKLGLRFYLAAAPGTPLARRPEFGLMTPGPRSFAVPFQGVNPLTWQIHRGRLEAALHDALVAAGAEVRGNTRATARLGEPHELALDGPAGSATWTARWVVDASGGAWALPVDRTDDRPLGHRAHAAWFWVDRRLDPDRFSDDPEFRGRLPSDLRWHSTNHLVGPGYWVWLIPLADGSTSVGVVSDPARHDPASFADEAGCAAWIARHEPELAGALEGAPMVRYAKRGWEAHARRTLISPDRWAVTGDTAAFLDPLFSSGLDLVALGNELAVPWILADLAGRDVAREVRRASSLFARVVEQYLQLYLGSYDVMGHPRAMMAKIVWDLAVYLGFLAPLTRSGRVADEAFMGRVGSVGREVGALQTRVSRLLVAWSSRPTGEATGSVDQVTCAPLAAIVIRLREAEGAPDLVALLQTNLGVLEQLAVAIFRQAADDVGLDTPAGPVHPYGVGLDPAAWAADGLFAGRLVDVEPWMAAGLEATWLSA